MLSEFEFDVFSLLFFKSLLLSIEDMSSHSHVHPVLYNEGSIVSTKHWRTKARLHQNKETQDYYS
jgi:hypothetical protein